MFQEVWVKHVQGVETMKKVPVNGHPQMASE
jgi:hypothetical protein